MTRQAGAALAIGMAACHFAFGADAPWVHTPGALGHLSQIVPPEYPAQAVAAKQTAEIEVRGRLGEDGRLGEISFRPDNDATRPFLLALAPVVPRWRFVPRFGADCLPVAEPVSVEVSFEMDGATPRIFVTHAAGGRDTSTRPITWVEPQYPYYLQRYGATATVYARIEIDASGAVAAVSPRFARGVDVYRHWFEASVEDALKQWRFPPSDAGSTRIVCHEVVFRLAR